MSTITPELKPYIDQMRALARTRGLGRQIDTYSDEDLLAFLREARREKSLDASSSDKPSAATMKTMSALELCLLGEGMLEQSRWPEAKSVLLYALKQSKREGDKKRQVYVSIPLGQVYANLEDFPQAHELLQEALALARGLGDRWLQGAVHDRIGDIHNTQSQYSQAIVHYEEVLAIGEELGNEEILAVGYGNLGGVYTEQNDLEQAIAAYEKAVALSKKIGADERTATQYGNLGALWARQSLPDPARKTPPGKVPVFGQRLNPKTDAADTRVNPEEEKRNLDKATRMFNKALAIFERIDNPASTAQAYRNLASAYRQKGNVSKALKLYRKSLDNLARVGDRRGAALCHFDIGDMHWDRIYDRGGDINKARENFEKARVLFEQAGDLRGAREATRALNQLRMVS
uniref:Tetratricopeptide repeat-containing protein n=1 Tax=Candidatus Kentrum sp. DK TaxID=2126562 RepID=A0A450SJQ5_9GAMM|nr:MAG: Tetratricopeptide repeat-containing protein [Candidatus Kentron sp. DK]VFJ57419.1 MAG: Tetratricopeptide repeat-containing protein [Candidatus Kentron sp. DK]